MVFLYAKCEMAHGPHQYVKIENKKFCSEMVCYFLMHSTSGKQQFHHQVYLNCGGGELPRSFNMK